MTHAWYVRPAEEQDIDALAALAAQAPRTVLATLPRTRDEMRHAVEESIDSFAQSVQWPVDEYYLLVLQDPADRVRGLAAIRATAGAHGSFFCFKNDVVHHASPALDLCQAVHVLNMSSDLTDDTQLLSFFTDLPGEDAWAGEMLSRARLLLAACWPRRFSERFFVSMGGWMDEKGRSPFWDTLGRRFFERELIDMERTLLGSRNRIQLAAAMPHFPIYVSLLPEQARAVMGQMEPAVAWPFEILTQEGFEADRYLDIFDGGPILDAHRTKLKTWAGSRELTLRALHAVRPGQRCLVAAAREADAFRCCVAEIDLGADGSGATLSSQTSGLLGLVPGDRIRIAPV